MPTQTQSKTLTRVDATVSDLFFNLDHDEAVIRDAKGNFESYDEAKLHGLATWFATSINSIGGPYYTAEEIIADFYARV